MTTVVLAALGLGAMVLGVFALRRLTLWALALGDYYAEHPPEITFRKDGWYHLQYHQSGVTFRSPDGERWVADDDDRKLPKRTNRALREAFREFQESPDTWHGRLRTVDGDPIAIAVTDLQNGHRVTRHMVNQLFRERTEKKEDPYPS